MKSRLITSALVLFCLLVPGVTFAGDDALDEALARVGLRRADLGWRPKGWWPRYPADIPYKLRAFDALFAEPLDTVAFTRHLAQQVRLHLDPSTLHARPGQWGGHLFQAVHALGVNPKFGGLRGYTANLNDPLTPLDEAIVKLHAAAGRPTFARTFDTDLPYPLIKRDLAEKAKVVPEKARGILGRLVLNIIDARRALDLAFRNVDPADRMVVARRFNLGQESVDAFDYCPQVDNVERALDHAGLWVAAEKCVEAVDWARIDLLNAGLGEVPPFAFDWESPWGWIRMRGGGDDQIDGTNALLIVDFGGDDVYNGPVAASDAGRPIGILLDLGGDDRYQSASEPAQGAGICGVGVLIDHDGNDRYKAERYAQGVGQFGLGLCADLGGDDEYFVKFSGQGAGFFGSGLLLDAAGADRYTIYGDGQGFGGVAGMGVLADRSGNDIYLAEPDAKLTGRPSYHSRGLNVSVSNAQGCAMGRRGDGADGHSWAGGIGALLDAEGDDTYTAGNWAMGTGYWFGIGLLHDGGGNDVYRGGVWTQATGAHFCIGVLIDEGGDDKHLTESYSNNGIAFAHDFSIALLINLGGDDLYATNNKGIAHAVNRSVAVLIDVGGDDEYRGAKGAKPGMAVFAEKFRARDGVSTYFADSTSLALFLDVGGNDTYWNVGANNTVWTDPPDSPNWSERNFSVGVDRADGSVSFRPRAEKEPSGRDRD